MTPQIQKHVERLVRERGLNRGLVLEVGSLDINGGVRQFFDRVEGYIGVDQQPGKGVDLVCNAHGLALGGMTYDTVLCLEMLEHDEAPWLTVPVLHRLLAPGGTLIVSTPTSGFPEHRHPQDYWRFMRDAYTGFIMKGLVDQEIIEVRDTQGHPGLIGAGKQP